MGIQVWVCARKKKGMVESGCEFNMGEFEMVIKKLRREKDTGEDGE